MTHAKFAKDGKAFLQTGPAGDVAHWKQELEGTLPKAGIDVPALPAGAQPQCTKKP